MRNHYEYEVGHFEKAIEVPSDTFREQLAIGGRYAEGQKGQKHYYVLYRRHSMRKSKRIYVAQWF